MKYMILSYGSQADYDLMSGKGDYAPADWMPMYQFMENFNRELSESGELVDTRALVAPVHTRRVASENGVPVVTDGPYAETEEVLAGWWIVECDGFDRATQIAAKLSACPSPGDVFARGYADVRPIADGHDGLDM